VDDALELRAGEIGEQREARDGVNQLRSIDHAQMVPEPASPWKVPTPLLDPEYTVSNRGKEDMA
jgi:hypothetical protein